MTLSVPPIIRDHARISSATGVLIVALLVYFLAFAGGGSSSGSAVAQGANQGPPPANVAIDTVQTSAITPNFTAPGDVVANRDSIVAAEVSGRIRSTLNIGTAVRAGSVIAVIDDRSARLMRDQAVAEVRRLDSDLKYQERRVGRLQQLLAEEAESEASLDEAVSARDQTKARLASARLARDTASLNLKRTRIVSPFAGQVVERKIQAGEYATPGREIARVVGRQDAEARIRVPIAMAGSLSAGQTVSITANGVKRKARIRAVVETGDEVSRTVEVRAPLAEQNLKMGSAISMTVPTGVLRDVLTVPRDALVLRDKGIYIYSIDKKTKKAKRVTVTVGEPQGERIEVIGPIKNGDLIVVRGGERLRDDQTVKWEDTKESAKVLARSAKEHG